MTPLPASSSVLSDTRVLFPESPCLLRYLCISKLSVSVYTEKRGLHEYHEQPLIIAFLLALSTSERPCS